MDDAHTAWYEREAQYIEQALETARVYQYKCPEISDYIEDFLSAMERRYEEKEDFIKSYRLQHGDLEIDTSGYRDGVQKPDSIEDLFCDHCEEFQFSVGVKGDEHYCSTCWDDLGMADQSGLTDYDSAMTGSTEPDRHYAVVGCGDDKAMRRSRHGSCTRRPTSRRSGNTARRCVTAGRSCPRNMVSLIRTRSWNRTM